MGFEKNITTGDQRRFQIGYSECFKRKQEVYIKGIEGRFTSNGQSKVSMGEPQSLESRSITKTAVK